MTIFITFLDHNLRKINRNIVHKFYNHVYRSRTKGFPSQFISSILHSAASTIDSPTMYSTRGFADSSPPEVTTTVPLGVEPSSNYLSLKSRATPRDRGRCSDITSSGGGTPIADLREAEGKINKRSCLQDDLRWNGMMSFVRPMCIYGQFRGIFNYSTFTYPVPKVLNEVAKVQLLQQRDPFIIREMWKEQFSGRNDVVTMDISGDIFKLLMENLKKSPIFILPIDKGYGAFYNLILQYTPPKSILCTSLHSFKAKGLENSEPYFIMTIFDELLYSKNLILLRGDIINTLDLTKNNAQNVLENTIKFYTDFNMYKWVYQFNHTSYEFNYNEFKTKYNHLFMGENIKM